MPIDPNAPAFPGVEGTPGNGPCVPISIPEGASREWVNYQPGISNRAWIATTIAAGWLASFSGADVSNPTPKTIAKDAVKFADALIAELNNPQH